MLDTKVCDWERGLMESRILHRESPSGEGVSIYCEVSGTGRPLVLGHSFLCSGAMWGPQLGPLSENCLVVNIDTRGHGRSGAVVEGFTIYDVVDDALAVLDDLGIGSAIWGGLSLGGMTALRAATEHSARVDALILLDTNAGTDGSWARLKYRGMIAIAGLVGFRPLLSRAISLMFGAETRRNAPELVAEWRGRFAAADVTSMRQTLRALNARDDLVGRLDEITVPTLVMVGALDTPQPPARSRLIAESIMDARFVEIPDAGHLSCLEQPGFVTSAILDFIHGLPDTA